MSTCTCEPMSGSFDIRDRGCPVHGEVRTMALTEIDPSELSPMIREVNRGLMVRWINAQLLDRAAHDVRKSVVLYDKDKMFVHALDAVPDADLQQRLFDGTVVRHWSHGV